MKSEREGRPPSTGSRWPTPSSPLHHQRARESASRWRAVACVGLGLIPACASTAPSAGAPTEPSAEAATGPSPESSGSASEVSPGPGPDGEPSSAVSSGEEPPIASGQQLCEKLCEKVADNCKQDTVKFCLAGCPDYQEASERCPIEVEEALTCQINSDAFLVCSSVASEQCAPFYQALSDCREGRAQPKRQRQVEAQGLPEGWQRVRMPAFAGSFALPVGTIESDGAAQVLQREGFVFRVEPLPAVPETYDAKSILRLATNFVGTACEKKLRLHGRYETGEIIHVRFTTTCETPQGAQPWDGIFHLWPGRGLVASVRPVQGSAAIPADADTFYFGFEPN